LLRNIIHTECIRQNTTLHAEYHGIRFGLTLPYFKAQKWLEWAWNGFHGILPNTLKVRIPILAANFLHLWLARETREKRCDRKLALHVTLLSSLHLKAARVESREFRATVKIAALSFSLSALTIDVNSIAAKIGILTLNKKHHNGLSL